MDVHTESISVAVRNSVGKVVMECVIETKASTILQFIDGLRGDLRVTFEEGTWAAWLYDLLTPHVSEVLVCNTRKNGKDGSKSDRIDACKLSEMLYMNNIKSVYHGQHGLRTLKELARSYLTHRPPGRQFPAILEGCKRCFASGNVIPGRPAHRIIPHQADSRVAAKFVLLPNDF